MTKTFSNRMLGGASKAVLLAAAIGAAGVIATPANASTIAVTLTYGPSYSNTVAACTGVLTTNCESSPRSGIWDYKSVVVAPGVTIDGSLSASQSGFVNGRPAAVTTDDDLVIKNTNSTPVTFNLKFTASDFSVPTGGGLELYSQANGSEKVGGSDSLNSYVGEVKWAGGNVSAGKIFTPTLAAGSSWDFQCGGAGGAETGGACMGVSGLAAPFSLIQTITYTIGGSVGPTTANLQTIAKVQAVPEPASLLLFGSGLLGLGAMRRRRRDKREAQAA